MFRNLLTHWHTYLHHLKTDKDTRMMSGVLGVMLLIPVVIFGVIIVKGFEGAPKSETETELTPTPTSDAEPTTEPDEEITPTSRVNVTATLQPFTPTPTSTSAPTTTPTQSPDPPKFKITYPTEGQQIELDPGQSFCIVDVPDGGNQEEVRRRHKINDDNLTGYDPMTTLCYEPADGQNKIMLQYRNKHGDESQQYTRNFTFKRNS